MLCAGTAKIADVGLARIMQHTLSNTATGDPAGTFAYAAPEMLMGEKWDDKVCLLTLHIYRSDSNHKNKTMYCYATDKGSFLQATNAVAPY